MPGVTTRKRLVKRASRGLCAWFSVCQAMSIANHPSPRRHPLSAEP